MFLNRELALEKVAASNFDDSDGATNDKLLFRKPCPESKTSLIQEPTRDENKNENENAKQ